MLQTAARRSRGPLWAAVSAAALVILLPLLLLAGTETPLVLCHGQDSAVRAAAPAGDQAHINLPLADAEVLPPVEPEQIRPGPWVYPVPAPAAITARFGQGGEHWAADHTGIDFGKPTGTPVVAATDGVVLNLAHEGAFGRHVFLLHADDVVTMYAHLDTIDVGRGASVRAGDPIGTVGSTGNSTGPHLHFEVRPRIDGQHLPVDPEPYLATAAATPPDREGDLPVTAPAEGCVVPAALAGGAAPAALPELARRMMPTVEQLRTSICPELPTSWIYAQVQAESSWSPTAWTTDTNGGAAGLYQLGHHAWTAAGGDAGTWTRGTRPPADHPVWTPETHLRIGITYVCGSLRQMSRHLAAHPDKTISPLDAMAVCHVAGCGRVTRSATGIPDPGEADCGQTCADTIRAYLDHIHRHLEAFGAGPVAPAGDAGPVPVAIDIPPAPEPLTGGTARCTEPDPTGGSCLTPAAAHLHDQITHAWPDWHSLTCHDASSRDHSAGNACDAAPGPLGIQPTQQQLAQGWALAGWLRAYAEDLAVDYIVWQGRVWSPDRPEDEDGWGRPFDTGLDAGISAGHYDRVHVTVRTPR
ncbi:M23 family metallopeptidase [Streptomyces sp. NPDC049879]|uniref:M23 family metallopeptidase n=1 Tax=Streptomyces sp. NPDC049879 TaxID=3365598 RepID=UPI0037878F18